jgi:hypothetical protein
MRPKLLASLVKADVRISMEDKQQILKIAKDQNRSYPDVFREIVKIGLRNFIH